MGSAGASGADSYVPVVLAYDLGTHGGARAGLSILYHGHALLRGAPIPAWAPHPSWRLGFAAASGVGANACRVRRVRLWVGAPAEAQPTPLHITRNGQDYEESAAPPLVYIGRPIVSAITPASGPTAGGSLLLLAGEGLRAGSSYYCRFGPGGGGVALDAHANAQWAGTRVLPALNTTPAAPFVHCATPAGVRAGVLLPQISLNGQDETSSSLPFRFYDPPALLAISPTTGPALGGTLVDVRGANLTRHGTLPVCRFGGALWRRGFGALSALTTSDALQGAHGVGSRALHGLPPNEVPATIVNATHALCLTPPSVRGPMLELALEIALNGHDFTSDNLRFRYLTDRTSLISVFPTSDSSLGGRPILLSGRGLANGSDARCRYRAPTLGVVETRALEIGGGGLLLVCPAPAIPPDVLAAARSHVSDAVSTALPLTLDVTLNGQQYSLAPSLRFEIIAGEEPSPRLLGVRPSLGPANGSSLVLISGVTLEFGSLLLCRFGEGGGAPTVGLGDSAPDVGAAIVRASYDVATGDLRCLTPPHAPGRVVLAVSFNGEHYEPTTFNYTFAPEPLLLAASPASGPAFGVQCTSFDCRGGGSVGTLVTVSGAWLGAGERHLYRCHFNDTVVPATLIDDAHVRCFSPGSLAPGPAALRLSLNAQDVAPSALAFFFEATPVVSALLPSLGPAVGGINLTLVGAGFGGGSHYECRFGRVRVPALETTLGMTALPYRPLGAHLGASPNGSSAIASATGALASPSAPAALTCVVPSLAAFEADADPAVHRFESHRVPLALTLNGQQFTSLGQYFVYHHEPRLETLAPAVGPSDGGLILRLRGAHLDGGDRTQFERLWLTQLEDVRVLAHYRCRFYAAAEDADGDSDAAFATVPATWQALEEVLTCVAPPVGSPPAGRNITVAISLNGITFSTSRVSFR